MTTTTVKQAASLPLNQILAGDCIEIAVSGVGILRNQVAA